MDALASTALYLASSLTTAGQVPGTDAPTPTATVRVVAAEAPAVATEIVWIAPAAVNPFSAARSRGGKSLDQVVAEEVKRDVYRRPTVETDGEDDAPWGHEDVDADVTAAHDARIALITHRMDELRGRGASAAPAIGQLRVRLRMAVAARCLAVARSAVADPADADSVPADAPAIDAACRPAATAPMLAAAAPGAARHRGAGHDRPRTVLASSTARGRAGAVRLADLSGPASLRVPVRVLRVAAPSRPTRQAASDPGEAVRPGPADHAAVALQRARRSLATARGALETGVGEDARGRLRLAGLLHWTGSESWSLADCHQSTA